MSARPSTISQPDVDPVTGVVGRLAGGADGTTTVGDTVGGADVGTDVLVDGGTVVVGRAVPPGPIVAICSFA